MHNNLHPDLADHRFSRACPAHQIGAVVLSTILIAGCATKPTHYSPQPYRGPATFSCPAYNNGNVEINFRDGVDSYEAKLLAEVYFSRFYGGCGMLGHLQDQKNEWYFPCYVGFAGTEKPAIRVSKIGCKIACQNGPTIIDPTLLTSGDRSIWEKRDDQSNGVIHPIHTNEN